VTTVNQDNMPILKQQNISDLLIPQKVCKWIPFISYLNTYMLYLFMLFYISLYK